MDHSVTNSPYGAGSGLPCVQAMPGNPIYCPAANLISEDSFHKASETRLPNENFFTRQWRQLGESISQTFKGAFSFPQTLWYSIIGKPLPDSPVDQLEHNPKFLDLYAMGQTAQEVQRHRKPYPEAP